MEQKSKDYRKYYKEYIQNMSLKLFRGTLYLYIIEARDLPNLDASWFSSEKDATDPCIIVETFTKGKSTSRLAKTKTIDDNLNPKWLEKFEIALAHDFDSIKLVGKDRDLIKAKIADEVSASADELAT